MSDFAKFTSIEAFHNVLKTRNKMYPFIKEVVYFPKIKLHGTNAGIRVKDGKITAQKRSETITLENDNFGFALWVEQNRKWLESLYIDGIVLSQDFVIHGEWAGPGVQKGVAVSKIPQRTFFAFAIETFDTKKFYTSPQLMNLHFYLRDLENVTDTFKILPQFEKDIKVNFEDNSSIASFVEHVNSVILPIEKVDPYIKEEYGIEGVGEGLVYYAWINPWETEIPEGHNIIQIEKELMFKAKGEEHRVNKEKQAVQVDPEVLRTQQAFADKFVTEARCRQGLMEVFGKEIDLDIKQTPDFLRWVMKDILKESEDELVASGMEWKTVAKFCSSKASKWYVDKCKELNLA